MTLNPYIRLALTIGAVVVLVAGIGGHPHDLRIFFASWTGFLVLLYIAGGGRLPWKIRFRDSLLYVLISLALVAIVILFALYKARTAP